MKVYAPNSKQNDIGGGFTFYRNFVKGMQSKVHFVNSWQECDIFFITGITIIEPHEISEAKKAGKKIVLRVDNVPRKSRNRRSSPHERLREIAELCDVVIYQSNWAKQYCSPLCGDGTVIYNGVDTSIFKPDPEFLKDPEERDAREHRYFFAYHGKNELKQFWLAHYYFQLAHREDPEACFWFIYDFGSEQQLMEDSNYDFWNGESFNHLQKESDPHQMAELLQQCKYLIYPSVIDASPNMVLEARACGCKVVMPAPAFVSGTMELLDPKLDISLERMCEEYHGVFEVVLTTKD